MHVLMVRAKYLKKDKRIEIDRANAMCLIQGLSEAFNPSKDAGPVHMTLILNEWEEGEKKINFEFIKK